MGSLAASCGSLTVAPPTGAAGSALLGAHVIRTGTGHPWPGTAFVTRGPRRVVVLGRLHVIVNVSPASGTGAVLDLARAVVGAGAPVVQLRSKGLSDAAAFSLACRVQEVCADGDAALVINDRIDIALASGAAGVHVGDEDVPVAVARRLLGPDAVVGATARTAGMARQAAQDGATYVGVGPCYATTTKVVAADLLGPAGLAAVAGAVGLPVIAIAGVTAARVPELLAAGAYGLAVVGAVANAPDPAVATKELLATLEAAR